MIHKPVRRMKNTHRKNKSRKNKSRKNKSRKNKSRKNIVRTQRHRKNKSRKNIVRTQRHRKNTYRVKKYRKRKHRSHKIKGGGGQSRDTSRVVGSITNDLKRVGSWGAEKFQNLMKRFKRNTNKQEGHTSAPDQSTTVTNELLHRPQTSRGPLNPPPQAFGQAGRHSDDDRALGSWIEPANYAGANDYFKNNAYGAQLAAGKDVVGKSNRRYAADLSKIVNKKLLTTQSELHQAALNLSNETNGPRNPFAPSTPRNLSHGRYNDTTTAISGFTVPGSQGVPVTVPNRGTPRPQPLSTSQDV
jgi:hypothetical protein